MPVADPERFNPALNAMTIKSTLLSSLIAASFLAAGCTSKAHWETVHEDLHATIAVDSNSIQRDELVVKAWVLTNHAEPVAAQHKRYQSEISLFQFRCAERRFGLERANLYESRDGKGEMVDTFFAKEISLSEAQAGSGMQKVVAYVCGSKS